MESLVLLLGGVLYVLSVIFTARIWHFLNPPVVARVSASTLAKSMPCVAYLKEYEQATEEPPRNSQESTHGRGCHWCISKCSSPEIAALLSGPALPGLREPGSVGAPRRDAAAVDGREPPAVHQGESECLGSSRRWSLGSQVAFPPPQYPQ